MPDRRPPPQPATRRPDKICKTCGRAFPFRKDQARDWDIIRHCSEACRIRQADAPPAALEEAILTLLARRDPGKTICPSEAAKLIGSAAAPGRKLALSDWQPLMEPARAAARRLVARGRIVITQRGVVVDPATAKGPIRLKLC